jgi:hypothetical protein
MPEPQTDPGTPTDDPTKGTANVSDAELEQIRTKAQQFDNLANEATELGFQSVDAYLDYLGEKKLQDIDPPKPAVNTPAATKTDPPKTDPTPQTPDSTQLDELRALAEKSNKMAATSWLAAQWTEHQMHENSLSEDDKSQFSKRQLTEMITGPRAAVIQETANRDDRFMGNVYSAAAYMAAFDRSLTEKPAEGDPTAPPNDTNLGVGQAPPVAPKEDEPDANTIAADDIIPDDPPVE